MAIGQHRISSILGQTTSLTPVANFFAAVGNVTAPLMGAAATGFPGNNTLVIDAIIGSAGTTAGGNNITILLEDGAGNNVWQFLHGCPAASINYPINFVNPNGGVARIPLGAFTQSPELNLVFPSTGNLNLIVIWHLE